MAESLGQKLRQAREERDISISEVAEQTRISALYLEAIENDDYRTLPGGIFNKGFVKSFAKYVGLDEHEALQDYAQIVAADEASQPESQPSTYRPEVLTDDSRRGSLLPTIIFSVLILGLMAWGINALVKYVQSPENVSAGGNGEEAANVNTGKTPAPPANTNTDSNQKTEPLPSTDSIKVKVSTTTGDPLSITATADGKPQSIELNSSLKERTFEAKESVRLSYYKGLAEIVSLEINGRKIETPVAPPTYQKNGLEYEITMANIKQILRDRKISLAGDAPASANTNAAAVPRANGDTAAANSNVSNTGQ